MPRHHLSSLETAREPEPREAATATTRFLQTGTGTVQTTAISTVAITAVIFSLVDRFMASSRERGRASRPASTGACTPPGCLCCDVDHAPTGCLSCLSPRPLVGFGWLGLRVRGWLWGRQWSQLEHYGAAAIIAR